MAHSINPEQLRTLADLMEKFGQEWAVSTAVWQDRLLILTNDQQMVQVKPDGGWAWVEPIPTVVKRD
jgi:hypothetical protein